MRIFISGGCKNGKSHYAQHLAKAQHLKNAGGQGSLYYIATMKPVDVEDDERITRHRQEREGWGFNTVEQPLDIEKILEFCCTGGSFLLDSLTALLANEMFLPGGRINEYAAQKIADGLVQVTDKIEKIVIVSDFIYSDALVYDSLTENYRKSLAKIDQVAVKCCDVVLETAFSNVIVHKGKDMFEEIYAKIP